MRKILFVAVALMAVWGAEGKLAPPKIEDYAARSAGRQRITESPPSRARRSRRFAKDAQLFANSASMSFLTSLSFVGTASARRS